MSLQDVIKDVDLSAVDSEEMADVVWTWEALRQLHLEHRLQDPLLGTELAKWISNPWWKIPWEDLGGFYSRWFLLSCGAVITPGDGPPRGIVDAKLTFPWASNPWILNAEGSASVPAGYKFFGFHLWVHTPPESLHRIIVDWADSHVAGQLEAGSAQCPYGWVRKVGRKQSRISWLADLAIYKAALADAESGEAKNAAKYRTWVRDKIKFPRGYYFKHLFAGPQKYVRRWEAKQRTRTKLDDIAANSLLKSEFGFGTQ